MLVMSLRASIPSLPFTTTTDFRASCLALQSIPLVKRSPRRATGRQQDQTFDLA